MKKNTAQPIFSNVISTIKVLFVFLLTFFIFSNIIFAQSYYYLIDRGVSDEYNMSAPTGKKILQEPANDTISAPQTLPFEWNFYGQTVTQYRASDNGYITFDITDNSSISVNTAIPSATTPNNAIYAFWDNLELSDNPTYMTNDIRTYTVGQAPNRVHVIQWHVTPLGQAANASYLFFALRIYEQGDFDILFQQIRLQSGSVTGTVGCENFDGTEAIMAAGSPNFSYTGGTYIKENCPVYTFIYGNMPSNEVVLKQLNIPKLLHANQSYDVIAEIINHGAEPITTVNFAYQIEDGEVHTEELTGLNVLTNQSYEITHPLKWQPTKVADFEKIKVWIVSVNGNDDANPMNDTLSNSAFVNMGVTAEKRVFIEEFSTVPCGFCPDGLVYLENIQHNNPKVIGMIHHAGFGTDSMTIPESVTIAGAFTNGAPTACIDRIKWPGEINTAISRSIWEAKAIESLSWNTPVGININNDWDATTRELDINIALDFVDYPYPGDIRLNVFIVEDSVTGIGPGYDQKNYYNGTPGHPMYGRGDPIVGYVHRHLIRAAITGAWGESGIIPNNPAPNLQLNKNYKYIVPEKFKAKDLSIIAFAAYYDGTERQILNTIEKKDVAGPVSIKEPKLLDEFEVTAYPNPFSSNTKIKYYLTASEKMKLVIYDILGNQVSVLEDEKQTAGEHEKIFYANQLPTGVYNCVLKSGSGMRCKRIIMVK